MDEIPVALTIDGTPFRVWLTPADLDRLDRLPNERAWRTGTPITLRLETGDVISRDASRIAPRR